MALQFVDSRWGWIRQFYTHILARGMEHKTKNIWHQWQRPWSAAVAGTHASSVELFVLELRLRPDPDLHWAPTGGRWKNPATVLGDCGLIGQGEIGRWRFYQTSSQKRQCAGSPEGEFQKRLAVKSSPSPWVENVKEWTGTCVLLLEEEWKAKGAAAFQKLRDTK